VNSDAPGTLAPPAVTYRTGVLWGVLLLFLIVGTASAAFFVYGLSDLLATGRWFPDLPIAFAGAAVATFTLLLITGILYRVDRLRGRAGRRVSLFE
jgi:hypothetical protein